MKNEIETPEGRVLFLRDCEEAIGDLIANIREGDDLKLTIDVKRSEPINVLIPISSVDSRSSDIDDLIVGQRISILRLTDSYHIFQERSN